VKNAAATLTILLALLGAGPASAQFAEYSETSDQGRSEFVLNLGYSNISLGSSSAIDNEGAVRFGGSLTFAPFQQLPKLRMGGDVGVSLVLDNSSFAIVSSGGVVAFGNADIPFWTIEPELRLSWRQQIGQYMFIEPGVAAGFVFGFVDLQDEFGASYDANSSTGYGKAFLRVGFDGGGASWGLEGFYAAGGHMDFGGDASGDFREWYVGLYGSLSF
jgi:hypothetical protein